MDMFKKNIFSVFLVVFFVLSAISGVNAVQTRHNEINVCTGEEFTITMSPDKTDYLHWDRDYLDLTRKGFIFTDGKEEPSSFFYTFKVKKMGSTLITSYDGFNEYQVHIWPPIKPTE